MNKGIKMVSIAGYLPDNVVTNDDLSKIMETSDEWIQSHHVLEHYQVGNLL